MINLRVRFEGAYFHYHEVVKLQRLGPRSAPWVLVNNRTPNPNRVKHFHQQFTQVEWELASPQPCFGVLRSTPKRRPSESISDRTKILHSVSRWGLETLSKSHPRVRFATLGFVVQRFQRW